LEVSIVINVECSNILGEVLGIMEKFIEEKCVSRLGALERRGILLRLHLQKS
jgi:hypothetical protein